MRRSTYLIVLTAIILSGLAFRVIVTLQFKEHSLFFSEPIIDEYEYDLHARRILEGDLLHDDMAFKPPLYSYALAGFYKIFGRNFLLVKLTQNIMGCITVLLAALLALHWFGSPASLLCAGLLAFYWPMAYFETQLLSEPLFIFLLMAALLLFAQRWYMLAAILFGLCVLTRPNPLILLPILLAWQWKRERSIALAAACCLCFLIPMIPFGMKNYCVSSEIIPWGANGGINFYVGNHKDASGYAPVPTGPKWDRLINQPVREGVTGLKRMERYWYGRTIREILEAPAGALLRVSRKALMLFSFQEAGNNKDLAEDRKSSILLSLPFLPGFYLAGPLIFLALACYRRSNPWLWWMMLAYAAGIVLFFVGDRYRLPWVVLSLPAGCAAVISLWLSRSWRKLAALGLGCVVVWVPWISYDAVNMLENDYAYGLVYQNHRMEEQAEDYYRRALEREPCFPQAFNQLGLIAMHRDMLPLAAQYFGEALRCDPAHVASMNNLGIVDARLGRTAEARTLFRGVMRLDPLNDDARRNFQALPAPGRPKVKVPTN